MPNSDELRRLREAEEKYRMMVKQAEDAIFTIDPDTACILECNPRATVMTGREADQLIGLAVWLLHPADEREQARRLFEEVVTSGQAKVSDFRFERPNGTIVAVDVSASVIEFCGRKVILRICRDVTERRRLQDELSKLNEELEEKVETRTRQLRQKQAQLVQAEKMASLGNLVAGVAHEINTPMGALASNNDLFIRTLVRLKGALSEPDIPESVRTNPKLTSIMESMDQLNEINKTAAERIIGIVRSLRNFARLDQADKDTVDIHKGLESTFTLVHHQLKDRIKLVREFTSLPALECFPNQLNQVFMNLLVNAAHAIEGKGTITVRTRLDGDSIVVEVSDTGKGIPEEHLNRIFDPGFTTKSAGVGTGLGLSIVHQIIADHNGRIDVESTVGEGTTFRIRLPLQ